MSHEARFNTILGQIAELPEDTELTVIDPKDGSVAAEYTRQGSAWYDADEDWKFTNTEVANMHTQQHLIITKHA